MKRTLLLAFMALMLVPSVAMAQFPAIQVNVGGGYVNAFGDDADDMKLDGKFVAGGGIDLRVTPLVAFGVAGGYASLDPDAMFMKDYVGKFAEARLKLYLPSASVRHGGLYGLIAMGKHWEEVTGDAPIVGSFTQKNDGMYGSVGLGLSVMLVPNMMLGAEARLYMNTWSDYDSSDEDHNLDVDDLNYWSVMATATFVIPLVGQ